MINPKSMMICAVMMLSVSANTRPTSDEQTGSFGIDSEPQESIDHEIGSSNYQGLPQYVRPPLLSKYPQSNVAPPNLPTIMEVNTPRAVQWNELLDSPHAKGHPGALDAGLTDFEEQHENCFNELQSQVPKHGKSCVEDLLEVSSLLRNFVSQGKSKVQLDEYQGIFKAHSETMSTHNGGQFQKFYLSLLGELQGRVDYRKAVLGFPEKRRRLYKERPRYKGPFDISESSK